MAENQKRSFAIMIVDDSMVVRLTMKNVLKILGLEVVAEAANGQEAVEKYKTVKPDLILLDLIMPKHDGFFALQNILEFDPNAIIVIISGIATYDNVIKAIKLGAKHFITKPFTPDEFYSKIYQVLKKFFPDSKVDLPLP